MEMKTTNIANRDARGYVERRDAFKGSNLFAQRRNDGAIYVVYSFGEHHPLFVYDGIAEQWYENMTYASRTTQKHRTQTRPSGVDIIPLHLSDMMYVVRHGAVGVIMARDAEEQANDRKETAIKLMQKLGQGINGTFMGGVK
jgi:hypothetical protein